VGTSTDELAAAAAVSKQTLYRVFGDQEGVFTALIHYAADRVDDPFAPLEERMRDAQVRRRCRSPPRDAVRPLDHESAGAAVAPARSLEPPGP
jgi:AcrR family transcriptional regulator